MTKDEALKRALAAVRTAQLECDLGNLATPEIVEAVGDYIRVEFGAMTLTDARRRHHAPDFTAPDLSK